MKYRENKARKERKETRRILDKMSKSSMCVIRVPKGKTRAKERELILEDIIAKNSLK